MNITLIEEVTHAMGPALIAALAVSLASAALARARRKLAQIAWPRSITVELRLTLGARGRETVRERGRRAARRERTRTVRAVEVAVPASAGAQAAHVARGFAGADLGGGAGCRGG